MTSPDNESQDQETADEFAEEHGVHTDIREDNSVFSRGSPRRFDKCSVRNTDDKFYACITF